MCINSVKETCFFSEIPKVDLSGFGNKLFNCLQETNSTEKKNAIGVLPISSVSCVHFNCDKWKFNI